MTPYATLQAKLQAKLPTLDPTTIAGLISAIIAVIQSCTTAVPTGATIKQIATQQPIEARVIINSAIRDQGMRPLSPEGRQAQAAILAVGSESTEDEINGFISYVKQQ